MTGMERLGDILARVDLTGRRQQRADEYTFNPDAVGACPSCDPCGWLDIGRGVIRCDHKERAA